ncbi:MAG: site-specific integrase [Candidatus Kapaibacterium sp.]
MTKDRKTSFIHLGYHILEKDWDATLQRVRKSHPNAARLNNLLEKKRAEANDIVLEFETQKKQASVNVIKRTIKPEADALFFAQARLHLERLKGAGKYSTWHSRETHIRVLQAFLLGSESVMDQLNARSLAKHHYRKPILSGTDVPFSQIDIGIVNRFLYYLRSERNLKERTIVAYQETIMAVFRQAVTEGVIDKKYIPFGKDKIRIKIVQTQKLGLSREDVERLETVDLPHPSHALVRDMWLISFYFAGMRVSDVLRMRWSQLKDGRLHYVMGKNKKPVSLKIPDKARAILDLYKDETTTPDDFVFRFMKGHEETTDKFEFNRRIGAATSQIDRLLNRRIAPAAEIEGKLTMHLARHTFATLAGDKIPIQMLQKLYRHSNVLTTIGYQANFVNKDADEALDAVLGK